MNRRSLLAVTSSLVLAGCLGSTGESPDDRTTGAGTAGTTASGARSTAGRSGDPTTVTGRSRTTTRSTAERNGDPTTTTGTPRPTSGGDGARTTTRGTVGPSFRRTVAVEAVDDGSIRETFGVVADVRIPDSEVVPGDTARLEVALRTTGDDARSLVYEQSHCGRNEWRARADGYGLYLFPAGVDWTGGADCPVVDARNVSCGIPVVEESVTVPASGALTWRYVAVVPPTNPSRGGCVVPGRYRFARRFAGGDASATLTFELAVADPE